MIREKNNQSSIETYKKELDNEIYSIESKRSRIKFSGDFRVTDPSWIAEYHN